MRTSLLAREGITPDRPGDIRDICRDALERSSDGLVYFDSAGGVSAFNAKFAILLGCPVTTASSTKIFPAGGRPLDILAFSGSRAIRRCALAFEGGPADAEVECIRVEDGILMALRVGRTRSWSEALLDSCDAVVAVFHADGRLVRLNRAAERQTGFSQGELEGKYLWDVLLFPEDAAPVREMFERLSGSAEDIRVEGRWKTRDGAPLVFSWSNTVARDDFGKVEYVVVSGVEITSAPLTESALATLSSEFLTAQSDGRRGVSRYLHDTLAQHLVTLAFSLSSLEQNPRRRKRAEFQKTLELVDRCCRDLRVISCALAQPAVDDESTVNALEWYARQLREEAGIDVEFEGGRIERNVRKEVGALLVSIFQEWGERAIRRMGIGKTQIYLTEGTFGLQLDFFTDREDDQAILGILTSPVIRERLRAIGGSREQTREPGALHACIVIPDDFSPAVFAAKVPAP